MTHPEISAYLRALPERPPTPSTAEIVELVRSQARGGYVALWCWKKDAATRRRWHAKANALRLAARMLARLEDDEIMREYASIRIPAAIMLPAYRAALGVRR